MSPPLAAREPLRVLALVQPPGDGSALPPGVADGVTRLLTTLAPRVDLLVVLPGDLGDLQARDPISACVAALEAAEDVRVVRVPTTGRLGLASRVARAARAFGAQVIHSQTAEAWTTGALAGRLARLPVVAHRRELDLPPPAVMSARRLGAPRLVLGTSAAALEGLTGREARVAHHVVPDPIDVPESMAREPWAPIRTVGVLGPLGHSGGQPGFVGAFARAFRAPSRVHAVLFDDEPEPAGTAGRRAPQDQTLDLVRSSAGAWRVHDRIEVVSGPRASSLAQLAQVDVLVSSALAPVAYRPELVEAMALGVPVVATDVEANRGVISDQRDGLLVIPDEPGDLEFALARLDADPALRQRLASGGLRTATRYTRDAVAGEVLAAYQSLT